MQGVRPLPVPAVFGLPARPAWARGAARTALGASLVGLAALVALLAPPGESSVLERLGTAALHAAVIAVPVVTGLWALRDARTARFGRALLGAAALWAVAALATADDELASSIGRVAAWCAVPVVVFLLLSLPDGRLRGATDRPALLAAVASTAVLAAFFALRGIAPESAVTETIGVAWMLCLPLISAAFCAGLVRRRLVLAAVLARLGRELGALPGPRELRAALQASLGDRSAEVLARDRPRAAWLTCDGTVVSERALGRQDRRLHEIWDEDGPIAAVVLSSELDGEDELVAAVVRLVEAALRETRMADELAVSLAALDASRQRIATAAAHERRRIERDLHDGAQQRLIALRMRLSMAEDVLDRDGDQRAASTAIHALGHDVDLALDEIRALAQGIYPALLADRGLADALRSVAQRSPLRVDVRVHGSLVRQNPEIEAAVYFTCVEALQNVAKHARGATGARIVLRQGLALEFHVSDDGVGFDPPSRREGAGLRNMRDRIESVGGSLTVRSWPGRGTAVHGRVPLHHHG
jgi:signal transduction histidine kinase